MMMNITASTPESLLRAPIPSAILEVAALDRLTLQIELSYANTSLLYTTLARAADLRTIVHFLRWDAHQPAFTVYLRRWLDRMPSSLLPSLSAHLAEEEDEDHAGLFRSMVDALDARVPDRTEFDQEQLDSVNYTFSAECAEEQDSGFFLGSFFATEIMSARRCLQLWQGLRRVGVEEKDLTYLKIHFEADEDHGREVRERLIKPLLVEQPEALASVQRGVHDRLARSAAYLRWYESERLPFQEGPRA